MIILFTNQKCVASLSPPSITRAQIRILIHEKELFDLKRLYGMVMVINFFLKQQIMEKFEGF